MEMFVLKISELVILFISITFAVKESKACFNNERYSVAYLPTESHIVYECDCESKTQKWLDVNGKEVQSGGPGTQVYTEWYGPKLNLYITSLTKSLSGEYKCVSEGKDGYHEIVYPIQAYYPMNLITNSNTTYLIKGQNSLVKCLARGDSPPAYSWSFINGTEIQNGEKYEFSADGLIIKNVTEEDETMYKCTATIPETAEVKDVVIIAKVLIKPEIESLTVVPENPVIEESSVSIQCVAKGVPTPKYRWKKIVDEKSQDIKNGGKREEPNKFVFDNITDADRGVYECIAFNTAGEVGSKIEVKVLSPPKIVHFANLTAVEGSEAKITCKASGRSRPSIMMMKSDADLSVPYDERETSETETEFNLNFYKVKREHEGLYICNATNEVSSAEEEIYMKVLHKPYFNSTSEFIWAWNNTMIVLLCEQESAPTANIEWSFQGNKEIPPLEQIKVNEMLSYIPQQHRKRFELYIKGDNFYGNYECTARNEYGTAKRVITVKEGHVPPAINDYSIVNTVTTAILTINSPLDIGPALEGFKAEYDETKNYEITDIHPNRTWAVQESRQYKLDKLKPMTSYRIRIAGINKVGTGVFGPYVDFDTLKIPVPDVPVLLESIDYQINMTSDGILKILPPINEEVPVDNYIVSYCPEDEDTVCHSQRVLPAPTEFTLDGVERNKTYTLDVIAQNSAGNSSVASYTVYVIESSLHPQEAMSAGAIIGISAVVVILFTLALDIILFFTKRQGMIANCCFKKSKKRSVAARHSRDKKGLLKDNGEAGDTLKHAENGHKEFEYNKTTGVITGKHSQV